MKRILITGTSGMLGSSLSLALSKRYNVFGTDNSINSLPIKFKLFDLSSKSYKELIDWAKPEIIIHCAALTDGNFCEINFQDAFNINGYSVKKLLDSTDDNVKIIYISTDAVFSSKLNLAKETDNKVPENIYGKSKELGEFFLINSNRNYLILRTTIVGINVNNLNNGFVEWILSTVKNNQNVTLFTDVLFNPISIWDFIEEIIFLVKSNKYYNNIFHLCGTEPVTKYRFGIELIEEFNLNKDFIIKSKISEFKARAKRSTDQTMDCSKYINLTNRTLPKLSETIKSIKLNYNV